MNRLNLIVDMLNSELSWKLYTLYAVNFDDEEKRLKIAEDIERVVKERSVWEGIRECVRKGKKEVVEWAGECILLECVSPVSML